MRGNETDHTLVLINGMKIVYPATGRGSVDLERITLSGVERIEVIRGSQSALYGSEAIGGVINVILKRGGDKYKKYINLIKDLRPKSLATDNALTTDVINYELEKKEKKSYHTKTIARRLAAIKSLFNYLYNFEKIKDNPAMHLRTPKTDKNLPVIVRENDIVSLMEEPIRNPITNEIEGERDHAILEMLYATGLRLSELLSINICDIDRKSKLVKVMGKGGKERIVPIGKVALNSIESYLKKLGKSIRSSYEDPLFVNKKGKRLPKRTLQRRIKKYLEVTMGGGTVHTLRHTFATHLVNSGADILTVKELLGHSSLSSTQHYTRLNLEKIKKVYQEKHPHGK